MSLKSLIRALIVAPFVIPIHAEVLIDAVQTGSAGYECIRVVDGVEETISNHTTERKAIARCTTEKVKDIEGEYLVRPTGHIRIVVSSDAHAQLVRGVQISSDYPAESPSPNTWICTAIGSATCDCSESGSELTVVATDSTDQDDGCFAHQSISSSQDIQLYWEHQNIGSSSDDGAMVGGAIRDGTGVGNPILMTQYRWTNMRNVGKYRLIQDGSTVGGLDGNASYVAPVWGAVQYDVSADEGFLWETDDTNPVEGTDWEIIEQNIGMAGGFSFPVEAGFVVFANPDATGPVTAVIDNIDLGSTLTLGSDAGEDPRNIMYELTYSGGQILSRSLQTFNAAGYSALHDTEETINITNITRASPAVFTTDGSHGFDDDGGGNNPDGITIRGLTGDWATINDTLIRPRNTTSNTFEAFIDHPIPGSMDDVPGNTGGSSDAIQGTIEFDTSSVSSAYSGNGGELEGPWYRDNTNQAGLLEGDNSDLSLSQQQDIGGDSNVTFNGGDYFMRGRIYYNKDYSQTPPPSPHFGNSGINKSRMGITFLGSKDTVLYNEEFWVSFVFYVPSDYESETGVAGSNGVTLLFDVTENGGPSGCGFMTIGIARPNGHAGFDGVPGDFDQWMMQVTETDQKAQECDSSDETWYSLGAVTKGAWNNFVVRFRINPFTVSTNPFNEGIDGAQDATFPADTGILQVWVDDVLQHDRVNEAVGAVPHATVSPDIDIRMYKFGWHRNPTSIIGPIEIGYGPVRYGSTVRHGTGYSDVHYLRTAEPP